MTDGGIIVVMIFRAGDPLPESRRARSAEEAVIMLRKIAPGCFGVAIRIPTGVPVDRNGGEIIATKEPGPRD